MDESNAAERSDVATFHTTDRQQNDVSVGKRPQNSDRSISQDQLAVPDGDSTPDSPPFWTRHGRSISNVSYQSLTTTRIAPITLEDHSEEDNVQTQGCWARSVTIVDHVVVSGATGIGAYVVWNCNVETLKGGQMSIRKRYSEFDQLRINLVKAFPNAEASIPALPRKSVVSRFRPWFLEQRKNGLNHFMNCILLNPEFAASPVLKEFVFSQSI